MTSSMPLPIIMRRSLSLFLALALAACSSDSPANGGDAGGNDAGDRDAEHNDSGEPDAGEPDAGEPDASQPDAGPAFSGRTFEDEETGAPPADTEVSGDVTVEDVTVNGEATRAVWLRDLSTTEQARVVFPAPEVPARRFEFDLALRSTTEATIFAIHGANATETTGTWRFMVQPKAAGSTIAVIKVWDGSWTTLGEAPGVHDLDRWSHFTIDASTTSATIYAGTYRFLTTRKAAAASSIGGLEVASSGTVPTGTDVYLDNLAISQTGWLVAQENGGFEARFPDAARLADGRILVVYQSSPAHTGTATNASSIKMTLSDDDGQTWSSPTIAADDPYDDRDPKVAVLSDGTVILVWFEDNWSGPSTYTNLGVFTARMAPGATTFSSPMHVPTKAGIGFEHAPIVELSPGELLLSYYRGGARVIRSHDGGQTWDATSDQEVVPDGGGKNYVEPNVVRLDSGELVMMIRTHDANTGTAIASTITRSSDGGKTWSSLETTDFWTSSHHMLPTSTGGVFLTFGDPQVTRRPTFGALIDDPSAPWSTSTSPPHILYDSGSSDQANPTSVELAPGRFLYFGYDVSTARLFAFATDASAFE